ncbi:MAG: hypothetical protein ABIK79_03130 [Chloroflexota bacterium]
MTQKLVGPRGQGFSSGHTGVNELDDLLGTWLPSRFEFGVDQVTVHGDLVHAPVVRDHVNGFDLIAKLLLQCFRYTSGNGEIASRGAIANTYFHLFLLCVIVMRQILPHTGAAGKRQLEGVGKKDFGSLSRAEDMPTFMWFFAIIEAMGHHSDDGRLVEDFRSLASRHPEECNPSLRHPQGD